MTRILVNIEVPTGVVLVLAEVVTSDDREGLRGPSSYDSLDAASQCGASLAD